MLSEDYVIRMIQLAVAALLRIVGLKRSGLYDDAQTQIDLALEGLLGMRASRARGLDDERIYYLLTRDGVLDTRRLGLVAALFEAEGDVHAGQNRLDPAQDAYARALRYSVEVFFQERAQGLDQPERHILEPGEDLPVTITDRISGILAKTNLEALAPETLWPLAGYWEDTGQYARAEEGLLMLASRPGVAAEIRPELEGFYLRLLQKPAADLAAAGLSHDTIRARLEEL